jgi:shikimate dehydrogenase
VVADIVMKPRHTRLLRAAAELGYQVHPGIHMLTHQIDLYRDFFHLDGSEDSSAEAVGRVLGT